MQTVDLLTEWWTTPFSGGTTGWTGLWETSGQASNRPQSSPPCRSGRRHLGDRCGQIVDNQIGADQVKRRAIHNAQDLLLLPSYQDEKQ